MNLINTLTLDYPCSLWQVRQANPNISFPSEPTDEDLSPFGYANVHPSPPPTEWDQRTQRLEEAPPETNGNGVYYQAWILREATPEEIRSWDLAHTHADWKGFTDEVMLNPLINSTLLNLLQSYPGAYGGLVVGLGQAASGSPELFISSLKKVINLIDITTLDMLRELSQKYNLGLDI